jgi:zona occludens toxin
MLVFNEGVPGAGKSYDALKEHILPALRARRKVFARLNGLDHAAIAAHLQMPVDDVRALLVCVEEDSVLSLPKLAENDALIVIDEAHKYYVASREPMAVDQENFFAEHRHDGQDIVLMSQWYRRLHSAVRARVERKAIFQKLTAVGAKNSYRVTYYQSTQPDRFEQTGAETKKYDPAMFPLYHGVRPSTTNTEVYTAGGRTVWAQIIKHAIWMVPLTIVGVCLFVRFFSPDSPMLKDSKVHAQQHATAGSQLSAVPPVAAPVQQVTKQVVSGRKAVDTKGMPDEVAYVFDTSSGAKPRVAALVNVDGGASWGVVEWQGDQGGVVERLTFAQLRDMGMTVEVHAYGIKLKYREHAMVVTAWPLPVDTGHSERDVAKDDRERAGSSPAVSSGAEWKENALARDYTPPDLLHGPSRSDWRPAH